MYRRLRCCSWLFHMATTPLLCSSVAEKCQIKNPSTTWDLSFWYTFSSDLILWVGGVGQRVPRWDETILQMMKWKEIVGRRRGENWSDQYARVCAGALNLFDMHASLDTLNEVPPVSLPPPPTLCNLIIQIFKAATLEDTNRFSFCCNILYMLRYQVLVSIGYR